MKLPELIERLEKTDGPGCDLDAEIAAAVRYHPYGESHWLNGSDIEIRATGGCVQAFKSTGESCANWRPPAYTTSVDSALWLVPPHHLWEVRQGFEARATVWMIETDYEDHPVPVGYSTTFPALALCIAALKARAEDARRHATVLKTIDEAITAR